MTLAAVGHVAGHQATSSFAGAPSGMGGDYNGEIILLLISSAGMIFIDHARAGQPQPGNQYAALGVVGFVLLFLGQFAPELAFAFTVLIFVSIIFNSPNGLPFISSNGATVAPGTPSAPGQVGFGAATVPVNQTTGKASNAS